VDKTMPPSFSEGVYFTLGREELPGTIALLRDRPVKERIKCSEKRPPGLFIDGGIEPFSDLSTVVY
jgi:hypothetical protein